MVRETSLRGWFSMHIARLAGTIGICALLGCSDGSLGRMASAPALRPGIDAASMEAPSKDGVLFVSDYLSNDVRMYRRGSERFLRKITGLAQPQGLAVDSSRNLYVSTENHGGSIEVFAPPYTTVALTIYGFGLKPSVVAVSNSGLVVGLDSSGMDLYPGGSQQLCTAYGPSYYSRLSGAAFDRDGNLYFDGTDAAGKPAISMWPSVACGQIPGNVNFSTGNTLESAGPLAIGPDGRLSVFDTQAKVIYTYGPPTGNRLGRPVRTTRLGGSLVQPVAFSFTTAAHGIFTADGSSGEVQKFAFPHAGSVERAVHIGGQPSGIALSPAFPI